MVTPSNDIIEDIFAAVIELAPEFKAALRRLAKQKRAQWAGDRVYIARRDGDGQSERNQRICNHYYHGRQIAWIAKTEQLSERQVLRIVNDWRGATM